MLLVVVLALISTTLVVMYKIGKKAWAVVVGFGFGFVLGCWFAFHTVLTVVRSSHPNLLCSM